MAKNSVVITYPQTVPVKAIACATANFGSQDCDELCFCGDAGGFVIKKNDKFPALPHIEWFCSSLARTCGVPQIDFSVVEHTDGNFWFGSSWKIGQVKDWWALAANGTINFAALADDISKIYALDLFINNDDRHLNNYFVTNINGKYDIFSFDYSRSWINHPFPLVGTITDPATNTVKVKEYFKSIFGNYINVGAVTAVLDNIVSLTTQRVADIIGAHPKNWLTAHQETSIIDWWNSGEVLNRVNAIKAGIQNGTLL
ncbi:MAG: hypothetical protein EOS30_11535 [Mesorhizobium sp.]|nr:MAG: hypothetical protein EOS30_11535 [Mesorhizobium sp.]